MVDAAEKALSFTKGKTRRDLDSDDQLALATVRLIEIIGEAAAKITPETREAHPEIPLERYRRDTQSPHPRV